MPRPRLITLLLAAAIATGSGLVIPAVSQALAIGTNRVVGTSTFCLQPTSGSLGAAIVQETCNGSVAQQWTWAGGHFVNSSSQLCLDARGGANDGTPIEQWTCDSITNENWHIAEPASGEPAYGNPWYYLVSGVSNTYNHCISDPASGLNANGTAMELYSCGVGWQEFNLFGAPFTE